MEKADILAFLTQFDEFMKNTLPTQLMSMSDDELVTQLDKYIDPRFIKNGQFIKILEAFLKLSSVNYRTSDDEKMISHFIMVIEKILTSLTLSNARL